MNSIIGVVPSVVTNIKRPKTKQKIQEIIKGSHLQLALWNMNAPCAWMAFMKGETASVLLLHKRKLIGRKQKIMARDGLGEEKHMNRKYLECEYLHKYRS